MMDTEPTIGTAGKRSANLNVETPTLKDLDYQGEVFRYVAQGWRARRRTDMTGASERDRSREPTDTATDNGDLELLETRV